LQLLYDLISSRLRQQTEPGPLGGQPPWGCEDGAAGLLKLKNAV